MPPIVRVCYRALQRFSDGHPVVLITKENHSRYINLPHSIEERLRNGEITFTHLSDYIRMALLSKYGGIWMDATLLTVKPVSKFIRPEATFWSCRHITPYLNVCRGWWTSFFLATGKGHFLPSFIAEFLSVYWTKHRRAVQYLLLDYAFVLARQHMPSVRAAVEALPLSSIGPLEKLRNEPFSEEEWGQLCREYDFHKMSYKKELRMTAADGRPTFYAHLLRLYGVAAEEEMP